MKSIFFFLPIFFIHQQCVAKFNGKKPIEIQFSASGSRQTARIAIGTPCKILKLLFEKRF